MSGTAKSRWADDAQDLAADATRKAEKEARKRLKAEKARKLEEAEARRKQQEAQQAAGDDRPSKRRKITPEPSDTVNNAQIEAPVASTLLRPQAPSWSPSRSVENFERLNHIEEGSYGWVSRAKETATGRVVALKKLKMEASETNGFPVTGLREIHCLMEARHRHIVELREVVMGEALDQYVFILEGRMKRCRVC